MALHRCGWKLRAALAILLILLVYGVVNVFWHGSGVRMTISKETTYITEPLRKDGYPDYVAALNQRASQGVTPENNAAVLFWKAMGPPYYNDRSRNKKFFEMLGVPPEPDQGSYFVELDQYVNGLAQADLPADLRSPKDASYEAWEQQRLAMQQPWSKKEFPILAGWLAANEKPLALVVESSKRPRCYVPIVASAVDAANGILLQALDRDGVITKLAARAEDPCDRVARALVAEAMCRLNEGKIDDAWEHLLACHRLARLADQGPTLLDALVADSVDGTACNGDVALLRHANLSASQITKMRSELTNLPVMAKMADKWDVGERFICLDTVTTIARRAPDSIRKMFRNAPLDVKSFIGNIARQGIDWDQCLRIGNSWYSRAVDASRSPARSDRKSAVLKVASDVRQLGERVRKEATDWKSSTVLTPKQEREASSQWIGQAMVLFVMPSASLIDIEDRATMEFELTKLAFALAAYRADHGSYPSRLAELTPKYVATVPKDVFNSDTDLHYKREAGGYLLYSVGSNGKDDCGKGYDDRKNNEDWDDLVIRMPAAEKR